MKTRITISSGLLTFFLSLPSFASETHDDYDKASCPDNVVSFVDNGDNKGFEGFGLTNSGELASSETNCIRKRDEIKALVAWNSSTPHKSGNGQQVKNADNLLKDWAKYGMSSGEEYKTIIVAYGAGGRWILNDNAFSAKWGTANPSKALVESLIARGAMIYMCQNTMKGNGWKATDLLPGVKMVPAGVSAVIDFQYQGYKLITP